MKIKLLSIDAGPAGVFQPGTVRDVPQAEAEAMVAGGYAKFVLEIVKAEPVEEKAAPAAENKAAPVAENKAAPAKEEKKNKRAK